MSKIVVIGSSLLLMPFVLMGGLHVLSINSKRIPYEQLSKQGCLSPCWNSESISMRHQESSEPAEAFSDAPAYREHLAGASFFIPLKIESKDSLNAL